MPRVKNSELRVLWIMVLAVPPLAIGSTMVRLNLEPERIEFIDHSGPFGEPWYGDPHVGYGWPFLIVRFFDYPTPVNDPGRFDWLALVFNTIVWLILFEASCAASLLLRRYCPLVSQCFRE